MKWLSHAINKDDCAKSQKFANLKGSRSEAGMASDQCPVFFSPHGRQLNLEMSHQDASAFLIAAGPSFGLVNKGKLRSVWTMTLNNSATSYRSNANCIVDDPSRFNYSVWLDPKIQKFVPMGAIDQPLWDNRLLDARRQQWQIAELKVRDCPNVVGYSRNEKFCAQKFLHEETINWGCHTRYGGGRSVMLPALRILFMLGFRRVYLLGVDFEMTPEKKYHFLEERPRKAISNNMATYAKLQRWFAELQPYFLAEKFIVKNCNPESKLKAFPFMPFDEAIDEATAHLGDYSKERTNGMYRRLEDKEAEVAKAQQTSSTKPDEIPATATIAGSVLKKQMDT